ncbi:YusW-like protein [Paenibacillus sp. BK033]|uniref:YusW family protein n=1 Tax=Paenibacillus sp. BK033 TaxID=2512133 RepID=UPI001046AE18|nr:YusW family protein [Paenibacillus sp. BK033]TCM97779.1 YusW-like protein [Paenibacillus sp. BK033]
MKKKISYILIGAISTIMLSYGVVAYADYDASAAQEDKPTISDSSVVPSKTDAAVKLAAAQPGTSTAPIQLEQLKELELKIEGNNVKVKIELEEEQAQTESKVEIKIGEGQKQYLTGSEATSFIQQLLTALNLQANMDKQQVMDALYKHFAVDPAKVELEIDIKMKNRPDELKFKEEKDDDADHGDDAAKVQPVQSTVQDKKAQAATDDQHTKQEQKKALIAQKKALQQAWQKAHKEQQEKKKQQTQLVRSDREHGQNNGQKGSHDDDQGENRDHDGNHGKHQEHEEHDED